MLRLVKVTLEQVDVLFELVCLSEPEDKKDLMAGLTQLASYFRGSGESVAQMVLAPNLLEQLNAVINAPFMPADAEKLGIPSERYLHMMASLPGIRRTFAAPTVWNPQAGFLDTAPQKSYLN